MALLSELLGYEIYQIRQQCQLNRPHIARSTRQKLGNERSTTDTIDAASTPVQDSPVSGKPLRAKICYIYKLPGFGAGLHRGLSRLASELHVAESYSKR